MIRRSDGPEKAETHHSIALDVLASLTFSGWPPVYYEGCLYAVDEDSKLWLRREHTEIERLTAERHDGKKNCVRRADYSGIAAHALSLAARDGFFQAAPVGLACPDGFYRVSPLDGIAKERLTPDHRQRVQLEFSPRAQETPHFDVFLQETFAAADKEEQDQQIALVQEIAGAIMLGLMPAYQKAVLFYDPYGRAGKGTLESLIRELVPRSSVTAVSPFAWNKEYYVMALAGMRLNVVGELPDDQSIPAANFKTVLGGDLITGRNPAGRPVTFRNEAAHLFMSNHLITTRDYSEAFFSRWVIVEFPNSRLKSGLPVDPNVGSRIKQAGELAGIAYWAMEGARRLLDNGRFSASKAHNRLLSKWRRTTSSLEEFVEECCVRGDKETARRSTFYKEYVEWCKENGRNPFSKSKLKELMLHNVNLKLTITEINGYETIRGLRLKEDVTSDPLDLY